MVANQVAPAAVISAPPLTMPPLSLVSVAVVYDDENVQYPEDLPANVKGISPGGWGRWVNGFEFLPELAGPASGIVTCNGFEPFDDDTNNCPVVPLVGVFLADYRDIRGSVGWKASDAQERAQRALIAHEPWLIEHELWTGQITGNTSLNLTGPYDPAGTAAAAVSPRRGLSILEETIAEQDAGMAMIHCTPYLMNYFASYFGFRYMGPSNQPPTRIWTPNGNLLIPGYGYPGTAPAANGTIVNEHAARYATTQWVYATDPIYLLRGQIDVIPDTVAEMGPDIYTVNKIAWRAVRPWGIYSNGLLRSGVQIDTTLTD